MNFHIIKKNSIATIITTIIFIALPVTKILADVLTTREGIVLNGKVIKNDKNVTVFSNYYGTFTINNKKIKDLHVTDKFEDDIKLIEKLGKTVNESEIKRNFQTGIIKKTKSDKENKKAAASETDNFQMKLHFSSFFLFNTAKLKSALPYSLGGALSTDLFFLQNLFNSNDFFIPELRAECSYLYSKDGNKNINGLGLTAGPVWFYYFNRAKSEKNIHLALLFGLGNYHVENSTTELRRFSFNTVLQTGLTFTAGYVEITPAFRYSYIHDAEAPLHSLGFSLAVGFLIL